MELWEHKTLGTWSMDDWGHFDLRPMDIRTMEHFGPWDFHAVKICQYVYYNGNILSLQYVLSVPSKTVSLVQTFIL